MSASGNRRSPLISRPWFVAFAVVLGVTSMAFAGYMTEHPLAFTSAKLPSPTQAKQASEPTVAALPKAAEPESMVISLPEVRITSAPSPNKAVQAEDCTPTNWRALETGPATREVRGFCPIPGGSDIQPKLSVNASNEKGEHLAVSKVLHARLRAIEPPALHHALNDMLPST
jgi:hypothetical protein